MTKNKHKKRIKLWESFYGTFIDKGAREEVKREKERYERHRGKNK